jgi:hypothetical protein
LFSIRRIKSSKNLAAYRGLLKRNFQLTASTAFSCRQQDGRRPMLHRSNQGQVPVTVTPTSRLEREPGGRLSKIVTLAGPVAAWDGLTRLTRTRLGPITAAVTALWLESTP